MIVVALSGWKRSGKDTAAKYLIDNGFIRTAFADVLKDMVATEYGIEREHCDNPEYKEAPILSLPVIPKDSFTLAITKMMFKEFRTADGKIPTDFKINTSGTLLGILNNKEEQLYWTPRALCILKGSTNRAVSSSYWVERTVNQIKVLKNIISTDTEISNPGFVISDLRYQSEAEQLRQAFGNDLITIRINRFEDCDSQDPSERDLDNYNFDLVINNTSDLQNLYDQLEDLL